MTSLKAIRITAAILSTGGLVGASSIGLAVHAAPYNWMKHQPTQHTTTTTTQVSLTSNKTGINVANNNPQTATTGSVAITSGNQYHHDNSGNSATAGSGAATNTSNAIFSLGVASSGGTGSTSTSDTTDAPTTTTGNTKTTSTTITGVSNQTSLNVVNNNAQSAQSGKVTVQGNGGNAMSGAASNSSASDIVITETSN